MNWTAPYLVAALAVFAALEVWFVVMMVVGGGGPARRQFGRWRPGSPFSVFAEVFSTVADVFGGGGGAKRR